MMDKFCKDFVSKHKKISGYCPRVKKTVPANWCLDVCRNNFHGDINENGYAKIESTEAIDDDSLVSVIIRSRNDPDINNTIKNLKETAGGAIEVIVILDGLADVPEDDDIQLLRLKESKGEHKTLNLGASIAQGDYLFVVDAHCRMSKDWDIKLKEITNNKTISVSVIREMDGKASYKKVDLNEDFEVKWSPKPPEEDAIFEPMMAFTGCGWLIQRKTFMKMGGTNEALGEWGHLGAYLSIKIQLDLDGCILLRKDVICEHKFSTNKNNNLYKPKVLTQKDFRHLILGKYGDSVKKIFDDFNKEYKTEFKTIIRCVDHSCPSTIVKATQKQAQESAGEHRLITIEKPEGTTRSIPTYYRQLLSGLKQVDDDWVWIIEQDWLYDESHFQFVPTEEKFYYNVNFYQLDESGYKPMQGATALATLIAPRKMLIESLEERLNHQDKIAVYEPGCLEPINKRPTQAFSSKNPNIDIRHGTNFTGPMGGDGERVKSIEPWGDYRVRLRLLGFNIPFSKKELAARFVKSVGQAIKAGAKPVSKDEYFNRQRICDSCNLKEAGKCKACGCNLWAKMGLESWHCPDGKW